jgi:tRNA uridine 5-carboxymethylaminomethyl modification enzyme
MRLAYDIIVVGGGHAGCEAAHAAAVLGAKVLLISIDLTKMAQMSCNPAMGGIAKGQIIREIDALGGCSGIVTDASMIQFRMLNKSKGPAVWSPRAQCDRNIFSEKWRRIIEGNDNIDLWQDNVNDLIIEENKVRGVVTQLNAVFLADKVVLTIGTFGNGLIHVGRVNISGGRISETVSKGITEKLIAMGLISGRMKTGTPVRIDGRTVSFDALIEQKGDDDIRRFSFLPTELPNKQLSCFIANTNEEVHEILRTGFEDSPLYNGTIKGTGPRYCPSIEDKIVTFSNRNSHQLFLEPEGWNTIEFYLNGFSSSLPMEIQFNALRKIPGFEQVKILRPGYAIEYDYFPPTQLRHSLESKRIDSLYFAGQINGTTGYEEAAAQGLMAGINAALKLLGKEDFILKRNEAYIGVLIDDLVTKGVDEPYRMFTSRAEYRILLRQDNADERLTAMANEIGMINKERWKFFKEKVEAKISLVKRLEEKPDVDIVNAGLKSRLSSAVKQRTKLCDLLTRPEIRISDCIELLQDYDFSEMNEKFFFKELMETIEISAKYKGYIDRDSMLAEKLSRLENIRIDRNIEFDKMLSISTEGRSKLKKYQPETIGQASRISGISPSDINVLLLYMGR